MQRGSYKKYRAFKKTLEEIKKDDISADGFEKAKQYHHDPSSLEHFKDFSSYKAWANNLYEEAGMVLNELKDIYSQTNNATSSFFVLNSERKIQIVLDDFENYLTSINALRKDIREFQACMLSTNIDQKQAEIDILSGQLNQISSFEDKIIETCNRKLNQISNSRLSFYSLSISIIAIVISLFY